MQSNSVSAVLAFAEVQMAAEALLDRFAYMSEPGLIAALEFGNNRSSKFTTQQAEQFAREWRVVAHQPNTETGFSGTVFEYIATDDPARGLVRGQRVVSFRSTEFADDAPRDNQATNVGEIQAFGWAFGQIADMKHWIDGLYASGTLSPATPLDVTGYSLGGHLATAFNLIYPGSIRWTYTHLTPAGSTRLQYFTMVNRRTGSRAPRVRWPRTCGTNRSHACTQHQRRA